MQLNRPFHTHVCFSAIRRIRPPRIPLRKKYEPQELNRLAWSIRRHGILQPLLVRPYGSKEYELISGEKRLRSAALCGQKRVPCLVLHCSDQEAAILSLTTDAESAPPPFLDELKAIRCMIEQLHLSVSEIAFQTGRHPSDIFDRLQILELSREELDLLDRYRLKEGHALELLRIKDKTLRQIVLGEIIEERMNVARTGEYIDAVLSEKNRQRRLLQTNRFIIKNVRIFENTIDNAVSTMQSAGIRAVSHRNETDTYTEYTVRIPKQNAPSARSAG